MRLRFFKTDIGMVVPFAVKEEDATGVLVAKNLTGLTVVIKFEDRDGNEATISGSDINITDNTNGLGTMTITAAVTTNEETWTKVQCRLSSGSTYVEHSDPKTVKIEEIAGT